MRRFFKCFFLIIAAVLIGVLLTSCTDTSAVMTYDLDRNVLTFDVPSNKIYENYEDVLTSSYITVVKEEFSHKIRVDFKGYDPENNANFFNDVKFQLSQIIPDYANVINNLEIEIKRDFYGCSISGTSYYTFKVKNNSDIDMPLNIIAKSFFMTNGQDATVQNDVYTYNTSIVGSQEIQVFDIQYVTNNFDSASITIDISDGSPIVEYYVNHSYNDLNGLEKELTSLGMYVEQVDKGIAIFTEKYDTNNDFQYVFPIRLYSMFGIMSTIEFEYGEFFASVAKFDMTTYTTYSMPLTVKVKSQPNTTFNVSYRGQQIEMVDETYSWEINSPIVLNAQYDNLRTGTTIIAFLTLFAIVMAMVLMIYVAYKKK